MAKSRSLATNLARAFDAATRVVYLVQGIETETGPDGNGAEETRIVYANDACLEWIDVPYNELKETRLVYTSDHLDNPTEHGIRGLHPPPQSADSPRPVAFRVFRQRGEEKEWIDVWGLRISEPGPSRHAGAFLVVESDAATLTDQSPTDELHQLLAALRADAADRHALETLVGNSRFAGELARKTAAAIASPAMDLVVCGPPGSGKEHVARVIFEQRNRGNPSARLIPLHCPLADQALVQETIRELGQKPESESGPSDCLLLLDVERLNPECQSELLGFFQLPGFTMRTLATAGFDIDEAIAGGFNSELASYLNTMIIRLEPLANRKQDLPVLAQLFLERRNIDTGRPLGGFDEPAMQMLLEYDWPENLDELKRCVLLAAEGATGKMIGVPDLPERIRNSVRALRIPDAAPVEIELTGYLENIECQLIERAMKQSGGNKTRASKLLGISRARLLRRIAHFGLDQADGIDDREETVDASVFEEADE